MALLLFLMTAGNLALLQGYSQQFLKAKAQRKFIAMVSTYLLLQIFTIMNVSSMCKTPHKL